MKKISILILLSFITLAAGPGKPDFVSVYKIGEIPDRKDFMTMDETDKYRDSVRIPPEDPYRYNRARFFLTSYKNGKKTEMNTSYTGGSSFPCSCTLKGDTTIISMAEGGLGAVGVSISVHKDRFVSNYYLFSSYTTPWKMHPDDAEYLGEIEVYATEQSLILETAPNNRVKQTLTGYLTFRSADFYEDDGDEGLDKLHEEGHLFFTCVTKEGSDSW